MAGVQLPENACPIHVRSMVNPGVFWVTEPPGADMSKEREELQMLEESLQKHCHRSSYGRMVGNYLPEVGELVAVQHPDTGRWHRAKVDVVAHLVSGYMYEVFLVDHGISIKVRSSAIKDLSAQWEDFNYQSFQVILYGLVPVTLDMDYDEMVMKQVVAESWTPAAIRFTKKLLDASTEAFLVYRSSGKKKVYGDLFLETQSGLISIKEILCNNEYAIWDEETFLEGIDLTEETLVPDIRDSNSPSSTSTDSGSVTRIVNSKTMMKRRTIRDYLHEREEKKTMQKIEEWRRLNEEANLVEELGGIEDLDKVDEYDQEPVGRGCSRNPKTKTKMGENKKRQLSRMNERDFTSMDEISYYDLQDLLDADKKYNTSQKPMPGWQRALLHMRQHNSSSDNKNNCDANNVKSVDNSDENVKTMENSEDNDIKSAGDENVNEVPTGHEEKQSPFLSLLEMMDSLPK